MNERRPRGKSEAQGIEAQGIEAVPPEMREGWQSGEAHITPTRNLSRREKKLFEELSAQQKSKMRLITKYAMPLVGVLAFGASAALIMEEGITFGSAIPIGGFLALLLMTLQMNKKVAGYTTEAPVAEIEGEFALKMYSSPNSSSLTIGGLDVLIPRAWGDAFTDLQDQHVKAEVYLVGSERCILAIEGESEDGTRHERNVEEDLRRRRISPEDGRSVFGKIPK